MISLIVPTYLPENQKYLDLAIESINNLDFPSSELELVVIASNGFVPKLPSCKMKVRLECFSEKKTYSQAINTGVSYASGDYYFLLSDDVILTRDCLKNIFELSKSNNAIVQGISNCDNTRKYQLMMGFVNESGFTAVVDTAYYHDQLVGYKKELMGARSVYPVGVLFNSYVCFYAVFIPKKVWMDVGALDEGFRNGQEDVDYCIRAFEKKVPIITALNSIIWHFSGKTADTIMTKDIRNKNLDYFRQKWGKPVQDYLRS